MVAPSTLASVPAERIHLVRHGEVNNPERILYGRLDGFGLTYRGHQMLRLWPITSQIIRFGA